MDFSQILSLAIRYGPYSSELAMKYGPLVVKLVTAVAPIIQEFMQGVDSKDPKSVGIVAKRMGFKDLTIEEHDFWTNNLNMNHQ